MFAVCTNSAAGPEASLGASLSTIQCVNMLHESTASSYLVQQLQRDLGRKHLPDEEHRQEYQVDLSDELQHWGRGRCPAPWLDQQNAYPSILFQGMAQQL